MNININADRILKAIKDSPLSVLVVTLFCISTMLAYLYNTERNRVTKNCDIHVNKLESELTKYRIKCNEELIKTMTDCRNKIDSIEMLYYVKFTNQEKQIISIENELKTIKSKLN